MRKQRPDNIYATESGHVPDRRHDRQDEKVSINRPNQKICTGCAGTNYLVNQGARSAAFLRRFVNSFF